MNNNLVSTYIHITRELASEYIPRCAIAGLKGKHIHIYSFVRYYQIPVHKEYTSFHSKQQCLRLPVSLPSKDR